jgi:hypothetical protein
MRLSLVMVCCLALAACSAEPRPVPSASAVTPPSSTAAGSAPAPVPSPTGPAARDGTNFKACLGGDCQIAVSKPVKIKLSDSPAGIGPFSVRKVKAGSVDVRMDVPAGFILDITIDKGCRATFYGSATSGYAIATCSRKKPEDIADLNMKQVVTVNSITDGTAILTLKAE